MNIYVIRRATQAVADYLNETDLPKNVAIGHDSRIKSDVFAREAAAVFAANGITAYLYPRLEPVPALSFAVRHLHCGLGICVTASHNPAAYNGYKAVSYTHLDVYKRQDLSRGGVYENSTTGAPAAGRDPGGA